MGRWDEAMDYCLVCKSKLTKRTRVMVGVGDKKIWMCRTCQQQSRRKAESPLEEVLPRLLAVRNERKAAAVVERIRQVRPDLLWDRILEEAGNQRQVIMEERKRKEEEARRRREKEEARFEKLLDRIIRMTSRVPGVDVELDDYMRVRDEWVIKIGIWPWGKTFLEGTEEEILDAVREILHEICDNPPLCPVCDRELGTFDMESVGTCAHCRAKIYTSIFSYTWPPYEDRKAWEHVWAKLDKVTPAEMHEFVFELFDGGVKVQDLYEGAGAREVFGRLLLGVRKTVRFKEYHELTPNVKLQLALAALGFQSTQEELGHVLWRGTEESSEIWIELKSDDPEHPVRVGIPLTEGGLDGMERSKIQKTEDWWEDLDRFLGDLYDYVPLVWRSEVEEYREAMWIKWHEWDQEVADLKTLTEGMEWARTRIRNAYEQIRAVWDHFVEALY